MSPDRPLILVSNRGPATFEYDDEGRVHARRSTGGLVTALTGLVHHRDALWIASAMSDADVQASREHGGRAFECEVDEVRYRMRLVESDAEAYNQFYNVVANPLLWFIQHYLWDLSNAPDIRREEVAAYEDGYRAVNEDLARAVLEELEGSSEPVVMVQKSTREGFGLTVAEAIWKARPFIGGNVGGIPLQIEDAVTGFLVSSPQQCAERALNVLKDPALGKFLGRRGKEHVRAHFLMPRYLRDYLLIFHELDEA